MGTDSNDDDVHINTVEVSLDEILVPNFQNTNATHEDDLLEKPYNKVWMDEAIHMHDGCSYDIKNDELVNIWIHHKL